MSRKEGGEYEATGFDRHSRLLVIRVAPFGQWSVLAFDNFHQLRAKKLRRSDYHGYSCQPPPVRSAEVTRPPALGRCSTLSWDRRRRLEAQEIHRRSDS